MNNNNKRILKTFIVGNTIRMFKMSGKDNENDIYTCSLLDKDKVSATNINKFKSEFHYIMKDVNKIKITSSYSNMFNDFIKNSINDSENNTYYDNDNIILNKSKDLMQFNNKCYFLNDISYDTDLTYRINEFNKVNDNINLSKNEIENKKHNEEYLNRISSYISETYDPSFYDASHNVNNKSIPIYDINYNSFKDISFIKVKNPNKILEVLADNNISSISSFILFDSVSKKLSTYSFDSIYIDGLVNALTKNINNINDVNNIDYDKLFDDIFSLSSKESFYRFLNPVGLISVSNDGLLANNENEYLYSMQLNKHLTNEGTPINYFSLKNLKNPEFCQDYKIVNINETKSIKSSSYEYENNVIYYIILNYEKMYNNILNEIEKTEFIDKSTYIIKHNNLVEKLVDIFMDRYPKYNKTSIMNQFNILLSDDKNHLDNRYLKMTYREYFLNEYDVDIRSNKYFIKYDKLKNIFNENIILFFNNIINKVINDLGFSYKCTENDDINILEMLRVLKIDKTELKGFVESKKIILILLFFFNFYVNFNKNFNKNFKSTITNKNNYVTDKDIIKFKYVIHNCNENFLNDNINLIYEKLNEIGFKPGIYFNAAKNILNEMSDLDSVDFQKTKDFSLSNFSTRMKDKIDNYLSSYDEFHIRENQMKLSGFLYGTRKYYNCFKSSENDMYLSYKYNTSFDLNFLTSKGLKLNSNLDKFDMTKLKDDEITIISAKKLLESINAAIKSDHIVQYEFNNLVISENYFLRMPFEYANDFLNKLIVTNFDTKLLPDNVNDVKLRKISNNEFILYKNKSKIDSYFKMLDAVKNYQFVDRIKGEHYYKEYEKSKSNVFSLNVKNSGLTYITYSFDEMIYIISNENNLKYYKKYHIFEDKQGNYYSLLEILKKSYFNKIIEDNRTYVTEIENFDNVNDKEVIETDLQIPMSFKEFFKSKKITLDNIDIKLNGEFKDSFELIDKESGYYSDDEDLISNLNKYTYFKCKDEDINYTRSLIKSKIQIRKTFENAIRKSIHRYIPINTTLWKIEYSGDDEIDNKLIDRVIDNENLPLDPGSEYPITKNIGTFKDPLRWNDWLNDWKNDNDTGRHASFKITEVQPYNGRIHEHNIICIYVHLIKGTEYIFGLGSIERSGTYAYIFECDGFEHDEDYIPYQLTDDINESGSYEIDGYSSNIYDDPSILKYTPTYTGWHILGIGFKDGWIYLPIDVHVNIYPRPPQKDDKK